MSDTGRVVTARPLHASVDDGGGAKTPRRQAKGSTLVLEGASDEALLATRLCDLPVKLEGTLMARRVKRLHRELQAHGIAALPHAWLSEEFFNPDGVLGFAIPFI
jgi:hypothetical protein